MTKNKCDNKENEINLEDLFSPPERNKYTLQFMKEESFKLRCLLTVSLLYIYLSQELIN